MLIPTDTKGERKRADNLGVEKKKEKKALLSAAMLPSK